MPEGPQGQLNLKTMLLYACVFFIVAYAIEMAFLNFLPGVPHFGQDTIAIVFAALITYPIGRRRHAQRS
jgi:hypothetical protein